MKRRDFVSVAVAGTAAIASTPAVIQAAPPAGKAGRIRQSVCRWCFPKLSLDELCQQAVQMGLSGIDLLGPEDFETVKKYRLVCTMVQSHGLADGLCEPKFHESCLKTLQERIEATAKEGWRNVICFSGNARGIDRKTGLKNCAAALKQIVPIAEKHGVILNMELLNSRVDHADYMCDRSDWGIELVDLVGSDHFKLLYDIYHMQIMEGDLIRSIQKNHKYFGHYHTAGNPGRNEMDASQEINYPPIATAIAESGFDGFLAHEFLPTREPMTSLREAVELCRV